MRLKRVAAAFDEVASKARFCESSGSEHSSTTESVTDLYGLVNSFLESDEEDEGIINNNFNNDNYEENLEENGSINCFDDFEIKDELNKLLVYDDNVKKNIHVVVENAWLEIGGDDPSTTTDFKRRLMTRLCDNGFDAGLCKSKWERNGQRPSGNYEYIDINIDKNRYIIEVFLGREFEIARPTRQYTSLLENFPTIFVGKVEELKQIVRIMSRAMKKSMKKMDIYVPPWRKLGYMQARWFGSYKRTINELAKNDDQNGIDFYKCLAKKRAVGFVSKPAISFYCRENFGSNNGIKIGNLAAVLNG